MKLPAMSYALITTAALAFLGISAQAQSDPGSDAGTSTLSTAAPTGTYVEAVVQVVFSDETDGEHPLAVSDLNAAGTEIYTFFSQLSYGKLDMEVRFIRVHLTTIPEEPATPATWANFQACGSSCNLAF